MAEASKNMVAFRLSPEMRAGVDAYCLGNGVSISDFYRSLTELALNGQISPGSIEGYRAARSMAIQLASVLLAAATATIPETLEEAQARGLVG